MGFSAPIATKISIEKLSELGFWYGIRFLFFNQPYLLIYISIEFIGTILNYFAFAKTKAIIVSAVGGGTQIFIGVTVGWTLLGEGFSIWYLFSLACITGAIYLMTYSVSKYGHLSDSLENLGYKIKERPTLTFEIEEKDADKTNDTSIGSNISNPDVGVDINKKLDNKLTQIEKMFAYVYELLDLNLINPFGRIKTFFAIPGGKYPAAYLWDSAFISGIWRIWDLQVAKDIMKPFLDQQFEDGQCPQNISFGIIRNKSITNPPLIAWALTETTRMDGNDSDLESLYPKLKKFNEFLYRERNKNGLFVWKHSYESGIDNSPRFTDRSEKKKYSIDSLWAVDFNTWMVLHNERMAEIARSLGKDKETEEFLNKREILVNLINKYLWDEETGYYYDYDFIDKVFRKTPTLFSIFPMFAKIPSNEMAQKLIDHIKNRLEFNTLIPFPTVARNSDDFEKDCWRGGVWINTAYVGLKSLQYYGETKLAGKMAYKLVKGAALTYYNEGSVYEFYDPDLYNLSELSRKKGNLFKQITLGGKPVKNFVGWSGLLNTILIENVFGIIRIRGKIEIEPHLPEIMKNVKIELDIPQFGEKYLIKMDNSELIDVKIEKYNQSSGIREILTYTGQNHSKLILTY